jgi:hypothetical protein
MRTQHNVVIDAAGARPHHPVHRVPLCSMRAIVTIGGVVA